jgi:hypothetical protein
MASYFGARGGSVSEAQYRRRQREARTAQLHQLETMLKSKAPLDRMTAVIVDAAVKRGSVTEHDFLQAALTRSEIAEHRDAAMLKARTLAPEITAILDMERAA